MKYFYISLVGVISAIAVSQSAYANEEILLEIINERHEAATLLTEPVSINSQWNNSNNLQNTTTSISVAQDPGCQNFNPLEFLENPDAIVKKCQELKNNQIPQRTEPVDYLKVPRLDSGLQLTVTKF
ncbi:MAG TPA: hypothetical protein IGS40_27320 [Trichormus sp. M33_DOE_039]|nr:hypothetical protein [Trichormus sp. M33_DOE_039]